MRKLLALIMASMFTLFIFGCGKAKEGATGFAENTYSATMVTTSEGAPQAMESKFYKDGDKTRTEMKVGGLTMVNIVRKDKKLTWTVIPENKAYAEQPLNEEKAKETEIYKSDAKMVKIGDETIDGHPCVKYEVTTAQQPDVKTIQWLAKDLRNFPIRMESQFKNPKGKVTKSVVQFKDVNFSKPAADLFEVPKDCKKVASVQEAMMGGKTPVTPKGYGPKRRRG